VDRRINVTEVPLIGGNLPVSDINDHGVHHLPLSILCLPGCIRGAGSFLTLLCKVEYVDALRTRRVCSGVVSVLSRKFINTSPRRSAGHAGAQKSRSPRKQKEKPGFRLSPE